MSRHFERGVIASPGIIKRLPQGFQMERSLSAEELRYYIMYWDKIIIPGNNLVYIGLPDEETLINAGAIERPTIGFNGSFFGDQITDAILSCQSIVAKDLVRDKKTDWVIHQLTDECAFPSNYNQRRNIIRVDISSTLPAPPANTNVYEILEFKAARKDELANLHLHLDSLYETILSSPDPELASKKAISGLSSAIADLEKVTNERFTKTRKFDFSAELNLSGKDISAGAASGAIIDFFSTGMTIPLATVAGAVLSTLKITSKTTNTFQPASQNSKLAYLSTAKNHNILD
ncbi:hypothetical protein I0D00_11785 [Pseudomonas lalucatii]|uniref:Uncharacterized protein n=1 Tax=Pseudomonas lalucatii TaxID=1424203 RepID=A0ABS5Q2V0_9PSED|nr:DUF6236 family protein [Pseudomonas lalucatii]MBS7662613.1 hypothetical protein [Pseudomonas lalucatii]